MAELTAAMLNAYSDAAVAWHRLFTADKIRQITNPQVHADIEIFISELRQICWPLVATENQVADLWDKVMPGVVVDPDQPLNEAPVDKTNQDIVDFVLNGTAYLFSKTAFQSGHYGNFLSMIVSNMTWVSRAYVMDEITQSRAATSDFLFKVFEKTPWLVFMYVMSIADIPSLLSETDLKATLSPQKQDE